MSNESKLESSITNYQGINSSIPEEGLEILSKLDNFKAPYLEEKLISNNEFENSDEFNKYFTEFKRFAGLAGIYQERMAMTSKEVDAVWHQFILFTPEYQGFCDEILGNYLHHCPDTKDQPVGKNEVKNFVDRYQATFGEIPSLWGLESWCSSGGCSSGDCGTCSGSCGNDCSSM